MARASIPTIFFSFSEANLLTKEFINNKTGEVYNIIFEKGTDVALFSMRDNNEYICLDSNGDQIEKEKIYSCNKYYKVYSKRKNKNNEYHTKTMLVILHPLDGRMR